MTSLSKRLIEVDLPIRRISEHARREKSIRHGHISTLHIWWARRPLAACRAVLCASLWPDPADPNCPEAFVAKAKQEMLSWTTHERQSKLSPESRERFNAARKDDAHFDDLVELRMALLDFIADFANWDNSTDAEYLATSRALTQCAHEAMGGIPGTRPLVVDPFAGGGSIPLEALRVGGDAFASDLNPIPVLLNKVILEYIPKYGQRLADEVRKWGQWIKEEAERELAEFYPKDEDGSTPIAYLWARTIKCEGPGCGVEIPLIRTNSLYAKGSKCVSLEPCFGENDQEINFRVAGKTKSFSTIQGGKATCPICNYTTPNKQVMSQITKRNGAAHSSRLLAVVTESSDGQRRYRIPTNRDYEAQPLIDIIKKEIADGNMPPELKVNPSRPSPNARGLSAVTRYGMIEFKDIYTIRQTAFLLVVRRLVKEAMLEASDDLSNAIGSCLTIAYGRLVDRNSSLCRWIPQTGAVGYTFGRQALSMIWDYVEINPLAHSGGWSGAFSDIAQTIEAQGYLSYSGQSEQCSATNHKLPDNIVSALVTDPPYYDAIPYADLSDFFYVWLRPLISSTHPDLSVGEETPKEDEAIWNPGRKLSTGRVKDEVFYEGQMQVALEEAFRITSPYGVCVVVFAHKSTAGWEALLNGILRAGWTIYGSWPIDTERAARTNAIGTASLASSVHLICRPRKNADGSRKSEAIGDWRDVLEELPKRIHAWLLHLAKEGVVGADAIFACLGPALEIFSRYDSVEKASGELVTLREYLEQVWAAVSREALSTVVADADLSGFESDARLSAMWLWTVAAVPDDITTDSDNETDEDEDATKAVKTTGFTLEYDAARKISQGLGANLDDMRSIVEVKGDKATLLPVAARTEYLFGKGESAPESAKGRKKKSNQLDMFAELIEDGASEDVWEEKTVSKPGETILDRVHQAMILFASGRGEALKRFLVDDGVGQDPGLWKLAQALSALYPTGTQEKRWVDGVLARKKGLGL